MESFKITKTPTHYIAKLNSQEILIDFSNIFSLYGKGKDKWSIDKNGVYKINQKKTKIYLVDIIYNESKVGGVFGYKNGNNLDLRKENVYKKKKIIRKVLSDILPDSKKYEIIEYLGEYKPIEKYNFRNKIWYVKEIDTDEKYCLIYINKPEIAWCKVDKNIIYKIREYYWKIINYQIHTHLTSKKGIYLKDLVGELLCDHKFYNITFKNNDKFDCRIKNLEFDYEKPIDVVFDSPNPEKYEILEYGEPVIRNKGSSANQPRNMYWKVFDKETEEEYYIMCANGGITSKNVQFKFSISSYEKIFNPFGYRPIWYNTPVGYICTTLLDETKNKYYLHQILMNHHGNGKGQHSVDHINWDKLDNRIDNLRIVSQSEQNKNRGKKTRNKNAKPLPKELGENPILPKYVVYYHEFTNKAKGLTREYFKIEKHPGCPLNSGGKRIWIGTKSNKVSIVDKLKQASDMCKKFDDNIKDDVITNNDQIITL